MNIPEFATECLIEQLEDFPSALSPSDFATLRLEFRRIVGLAVEKAVEECRIQNTTN